MASSPEHTLNHARGLFQAYSKLSHSLIASSSSFLRDNALDESIRAWKHPQRWLSTQSLLFSPIPCRKKQRRIRNNSPKCYASRPTCGGGFCSIIEIASDVHVWSMTTDPSASKGTFKSNEKEVGDIWLHSVPDMTLC